MKEKDKRKGKNPVSQRINSPLEVALEKSPETPASVTPAKESSSTQSKSNPKHRGPLPTRSQLRIVPPQD